ncbi:MAG: helix-turn-helix transcriptional regulator [Firmicutes bacterium]|nr:helix-turn-helix transcriptional regulator [Bacillota bacterium]
MTTNEDQKDTNLSLEEFAEEFNSKNIPTFKESITNRILQLANESGLTTSRLAIKSGMPPATLYDIVQTKNTKLPNLLTVKRLCDTFNISLAEFFDTDEINNAPTE